MTHREMKKKKKKKNDRKISSGIGSQDHLFGHLFLEIIDWDGDLQGFNRKSFSVL